MFFIQTTINDAINKQNLEGDHIYLTECSADGYRRYDPGNTGWTAFWNVFLTIFKVVMVSTPVGLFIATAYKIPKAHNYFEYVDY